ncbi:Golgi-specific brefeldin A-resistance guanine nucleotide exchange factor 1-like [Melitaea cinxia]|uniref:Golgi-specific brefeldin A-resistance guanine nucleotide exchange factor 1-like n=1 Tax=Melitaea cinxia TaxID=113334 RepID=UPI001E2719AA|nr:Golgi-specific brefeldin A-resistance guanine nucleotide exchange factor 1-like [Melitaea cinxia]
MVMPAERVGPLRDAYLWRVLQRRGRAPVTALSASFERAPPPSAEDVSRNNTRDCAALAALAGLERCAALLARLPAHTLSLDTLLLTLCKFTGLLAPQHTSYIAIGVSLGQSSKAQCALRRACAVAARHADCVRDSWRHILELLNTLYIGRLLPQCLVEAEDYLAPGGKVSLIREDARGGDSGLLSSIYSYIALGESAMRAPTPHEKSLIDAASECVAKCNFPGLLVTETKFLQLESLQELVRAMVTLGAPPDSDSVQLNPQLEDITIFFLELLGRTLRPCAGCVAGGGPAHGARGALGGRAGRGGADPSAHGAAALRGAPHALRARRAAAAGAPHAALPPALPAVLPAGGRREWTLSVSYLTPSPTPHTARLMRCEPAAPPLLAHLTLLYRLPYRLFYQQADVISCGLYELVKTSAQNVHSGAEWSILLSLLAAAGAGAWPRTNSESILYTQDEIEPHWH